MYVFFLIYTGINPKYKNNTMKNTIYKNALYYMPYNTKMDKNVL